MGMLVNGKWTDRRPDVVGGRFVRPESQFRNFISADGSSGFRAEPGRFGRGGGLGTSWYSDPREDMVTILMTQRAWTSPSPPDVCLDFWTSAYQTMDD